MAESTKGKDTLIFISSSEEEGEEEEVGEDEVSDDSEHDEEEEEKEEDDDYDYDYDDDGDKQSDIDEEEDNDCDDESLCNKVVRLLKERCDLDCLTLKECKAYLRINALRLTGIKTVCIHRIKEHWRLKDGNGEALYPRQSFFINCTGDVCKGDVVLFTQKVYEKFDKVTRHGRVLGKRIVAGRVVKESYGANKQQHTFTVEVLWSKGFKKLPPLFPLLVKGRNLYKLKTFRQRWDNEEERLKVLAEKHKRGFEARLARATKQKKKWTENGGAKRAKKFDSTRPSQMKRSTESRERDFDRLEKAKSLGFVSSDNHRRRQDIFPVRHRNQNAMPRGSRCSRGHKKSFHRNRRVTTS
nr:zinc finger CCCH domain-containing protein 62 isoform X2 [Ziziphus jujuba var. spinosa]